MKNIIIAFSVIILSNSFLYSQNEIENILAEVEKNNSTLFALKNKIDADKIGNKTGNYPDNPEFEFNYLWGSPSQFGNRTDISIKQTIDFPTAYGLRNQIADLKNEQLELEYQKQRMSVLFETRQICNDLIYYNALKTELSVRLSQAQTLASSYKSKYEKGEINILEDNKAQLNLLTITKELEAVEIERKSLLGELFRLNGGIKLEFVTDKYPEIIIPADFDQWYLQAEQTNPLLNWLKTEIEVLEKQVGLSKAMSFPKIQAGYMSETVVGQQFQGISVGITIPLWENKNKVKYCKAEAMAIESIESDKKVQLYNQLKTLHEKIIAIQKNVSDYKKQLELINSTDLLKKALDEGEISLIEYILELAIYHQSVNRLLELEREMNKTKAELIKYI